MCHFSARPVYIHIYRISRKFQKCVIFRHVTFQHDSVQCIKNVAGRPAAISYSMQSLHCRRANEQKIFLVFGFLPMTSKAASSSIINLFKNKKPILSGVDHSSSDFSKNKTILNISTEMKKILKVQDQVDVINLKTLYTLRLLLFITVKVKMSIIQKTFNDLYNKVRNHEKSTITNPRYDGRIQYLFLRAI